MNTSLTPMKLSSGAPDNNTWKTTRKDTWRIRPDRISGQLSVIIKHLRFQKKHVFLRLYSPGHHQRDPKKLRPDPANLGPGPNFPGEGWGGNENVYRRCILKTLLITARRCVVFEEFSYTRVNSVCGLGHQMSCIFSSHLTSPWSKDEGPVS